MLACVECNRERPLRRTRQGTSSWGVTEVARQDDTFGVLPTLLTSVSRVKFASMYSRVRRSAGCRLHSCFAELFFKTTKCGTHATQACSTVRATDPTGSYAMANRKLGPALVLGVVSVLALSTATPSVGQTQHQRPAAQEQGRAPAAPPADETFGQAAPRAQSPNQAAVRQPGSCWIPTNEDFGVGYWGACSDKRSRPVK